ncbi:MAG: CHAT domain-containing protein [Acidobacteria bacterium]|nr:CHAT domain-containing protein [Acidobacteriota bacterium]
MSGLQRHLLRAVPLLLFLASVLTGSYVAVRRPAELLRGQAISARILRGQTHVYKLHLKTGQHVRVEVFQHEIDLGVAVVSADGRRVPAMDGSEWGWESVSIAARSTDIYQIEVIAPPDDTAVGRYTLVTSALDLPLADVEDAEAAQALFHRAIQLEREALESSQRVAADCLSRAVSLWHASGERRRAAQALLRLGDIYHRAGRYREAEEVYRSSLERWDYLRDDFGRAEALRKLSINLDAVGQKAEVSRLVLETERLREQLKDRRLQDRKLQAQRLYDQASSEKRKGNYQRAVDLGLSALKVREELGDLGAVASVLHPLSLAHAALGQFDLARANAERFLQIRQEQNDQRGEAAGHWLLGFVYERMGRYPQAIASLKQALRLRQLQGDRPATVHITRLIGACEAKIGNVTGAVSWMREAQHIEVFLRSDLSAAKQRAGFSEHLLVPDAEVRTLIQFHQRDPNSRHGLEAFRAADSALGRHLLEEQPRLEKTSLADLQEIPNRDGVLFEYWLSEIESYLFVLSSHGLKVFTLPDRNHIEPLARQLYGLLTARARHLPDERATEARSRILKADSECPKLSRQLGEILLPAGAIAELGSRPLTVAASGVLGCLPFAVLPDPTDSSNRLLGLTRPINNIPSAAAALGLRRRRTRSADPKKLVAVLTPGRSGPETGQSLPDGSLSKKSGKVSLGTVRNLHRAGLARLPFARKETEAILKLAPAGTATRMESRPETREALLEGALSQHRILHFATHGFVDTDDPDRSGMALSTSMPELADGRGILFQRDVYRLQLAADLVVLSACDTSLGREYSAEATLGLSSAFLHAGAGQVVSTAWKIDDEATAEFMEVFYQHIFSAGVSPSEALRLARQSLAGRDRWQSPYFWAGFLIHGAGRPGSAFLQQK